MSTKVETFEWDTFNLEHLNHAHPDLSLDLLEEIVLTAKEYSQWGSDGFGKKIFGAKRGRLIVLFNLKGIGIARSFSVREVRK